MFKYNTDHIFPVLDTTEINGKRHYISPTGAVLPSVTTVIYQKEKESLKSWRKYVGEEKANWISTTSKERGDKIHSVCENYLKNQDINIKSMMPNIKALFLSIRPFLNSIDTIYAQETCLYSDELGFAGRVDCIATLQNGPLAVIDFKGSTRVKKLSLIEDYCIQTAAYTALWEAATHMSVNDAYIVMAVEELDQCQVFHINPKEYLGKLNKLLANYKLINNI